MIGGHAGRHWITIYKLDNVVISYYHDLGGDGIVGQRDKIPHAVLEEELATLPVGSYVIKVMKGREQPSLQWSENGKTKSRYIKKDEREDVMKQLERHSIVQAELKRLKKELATLPSASVPPSCHTHVVSGAGLNAMVQNVSGLQKRDCFSTLQKYIHGSSYGKVCLLCGLRRTGKTTLLLQAIAEMSPEDAPRWCI